MVDPVEPSRPGPSAIPAGVNAILAALAADQRATVEAIIQTALEEARQFRITDLWNGYEVPATYWILLLSGINQEDELRIAETILFWQAFFAKDSAKVRCVQSSERDEFRFCSQYFEANSCPVLVLSDSPDMTSYLRIQGELLFYLSAQAGGLQRFLTRVHQLVETGTPLREIERLILSEQFWRAIKLTYKEIKGLISISIEAGK